MNINEHHHGGFVLPFVKAKRESARPGSTQSNRIPLLGFLPNKVRNHFIAMAGEFVGTFLFLFFAFAGTQVANTQNGGGANATISQAPNPAQLLYISLAFGFSLAVNAWIFFRISGGLFNPAVTFAMCLVGAVPWLRGGLIFISQMLGGIAAAGVIGALYPGPLNVRTSLGGGTSIVQGLFIEMFLTAQLVFTIFMLAAEKHKGTFIAPIGIGLSLFIAELSGVYYTGGSLNPARSFGPDVINRKFFGYHWIYWVGPFLGSLLASGFYKFMKMIEYETANPGQDFNDIEATVFDPEKDTNRPNVSMGASDYIVEGSGQIRPGSGLSHQRTGSSNLDRAESAGQKQIGDTSNVRSERRSTRSTSLKQGDMQYQPDNESYGQSSPPTRDRLPSSASSGQPLTSALKGTRQGPTYPPVEGAANYDPVNPPADAFGGDPVVAARYVPHGPDRV